MSRDCIHVLTFRVACDGPEPSADAGAHDEHKVIDARNVKDIQGGRVFFRSVFSCVKRLWRSIDRLPIMQYWLHLSLRPRRCISPTASCPRLCTHLLTGNA